MPSGDADQTTGQRTDAAERSAHVTRGGPERPARLDPFVGPEFGPVRLRVVAELEAENAKLRAALGLAHNPAVVAPLGR